MAKKTPTPKQTYIAIDNNRDEVIATGTLGDLEKAIEEYIDVECYDESEVGCIKVFELGKEKLVLAHIHFDVAIEE